MLTNSANPAARLELLMSDRAALYDEIADVVVSTDGRHVYEVAEKILCELAMEF